MIRARFFDSGSMPFINIFQISFLKLSLGAFVSVSASNLAPSLRGLLHSLLFLLLSLLILTTHFFDNGGNRLALTIWTWKFFNIVEKYSCLAQLSQASRLKPCGNRCYWVSPPPPSMLQSFRKVLTSFFSLWLPRYFPLRLEFSSSLEKSPNGLGKNSGFHML